MSKRMTSIYALYKGDDFIEMGTIQELSTKLGKSLNMLIYMTYPIYEKRTNQRISKVGHDNYLHLVNTEIEDDAS